MDRRAPLHVAVKGVKAVKAVAVRVGMAAGIAAVLALVLVLVGVVTSLVTTKPNPGLVALLFILAVLAALLAAAQQRGSQAQPLAGSVGLYNPLADGPGFFAGIAYSANTWPSSASSQPSAPDSESGPLVNRDSEREQLGRTLAEDVPSIIVVDGPSGVGKSALVSCALLEMDLSETTVRRYDLPGDRFDAKILCEDITSNGQSETGLAPGEDVLNRLEAAMEEPDGTPVTIVVDGAQVLVDPDTDAFINLELAEAIGVIFAGQRKVKVILVFRTRPLSQAGSEWLDSAVPVSVDALDRDDFTIYLQQLYPGGEFGLADLDSKVRDGLYKALRGIPRLAELFRTVLDLPGRRRNAEELARYLAGKPADEAERLLVEELVGCLSDDQRRVMMGLAAYGTPVTVSQLQDLLEGEPDQDRVPIVLEDLASIHVISKTSDRYYVPVSGIQDALTRFPDEETPRYLLRQASTLLSDNRQEQIKQPADLDMYFAELDILIRRQLWGASYELINKTEKQLQRWNAAGLLLKYRESIAGKLRVSYQEMANYNAMGCIYLSRGSFVKDSRGSFKKAEQAFGNALRRASAVARAYPPGRQKIYINLGAMYLESGKTPQAERHYRDALDMAGEKDVLDRMAAMAGLADCFRRHGDYDQAISYGKLSLSAAQGEHSPWAADIAVKLARWHSELNEPEEALRLMEVADEEAAKHPDDPALLVRCLDGRADLQLDAAGFGTARSVAEEALTKARAVAQEALAEALELNSPLTVMQARTTMAMACLRLGDLPTAIREIRRAAPYRREGRSLVVLALQALITFQADPDAEDPRKLFARLEREAALRRERDVRDFAAWDFEGLAICGTRVGRVGSLYSAVAAFRHAREQAAPPGLNARMRFWLEILQAKASPGQMDPVLAAAAGTAVRPDPP